MDYHDDTQDTYTKNSLKEGIGSNQFIQSSVGDNGDINLIRNTKRLVASFSLGYRMWV